jgi:ATP-dependent DNA helicase RecG
MAGPTPALLSPDQIYAQADQKLLSTFGEDRRLERKSSGIAAATLGEYFSMWANTSTDGGLIAIGVRDNGVIEGLSRLGEPRLNEIEQAGANYCPDAKYSSKRIAVVNERGEADFILLIRVHYNEKKVVETVRQDAFVRIGDTKRKLNHDEIRELKMDKKQLDLELEPCTTPYPEGFDLEASKQFAIAIKEAFDLSEAHTVEKILTLRRLGKTIEGRFQPNTACALLFGHDPVLEFPGCKIRFLRYEGESEKSGVEYNAVKDFMLEGSVPELIVKAERVIDSQLRDFSRLGPDLRFYTAPEYPKAAWYEAIVNACVHRSYNLRNMNIFVKMFDDRLQIESPGGFPPFVTPENIYSVSQPRNPHLMNALLFLRVVKAANEGTKRMRDTMAQENLPAPEFSQKDIGHPIVRVTLRNNVKQRRVWVDSTVSHIIGEIKSSELSEEEMRVINYVAENGSINVTQCQRLTGLNWPNSKKTLKRLATIEILVHMHRPGEKRDPYATFVLRPEYQKSGETT